MACVINPIAHVNDVASVLKRLFPVAPRTSTQDDSTDEEEDIFRNVDGLWTNDVVDTMTQTWLQDCHVSMSSTTELLVLAHESSMIILTSKWNFQEEGVVKTKYHITWHGNPCKDKSERITSVLCLPLLSQGKSSQCGTDWTCIAVGFSSGYIRFYTEDCSLLLAEKLHNERVLQLKCQAYQPGLPECLPESIEEIYAAYKTVVCIIPGFGLFQTLRACRNHLARVQANCGEMVQAPPLIYMKLGFHDQAVVLDCEVAGPATANTYDHLETATICGGFNTWYRSSAPQTSLVVAAGNKPFVAFHYALEGGAPPVLADVAKVMAQKIKSAIGQAMPSWFMGGKKNQAADKSAEVAMEPAEPMGCRFGMCDALRHAYRVVLSPHRTHCVVCDDLGRITLVDTHEGTVIRMWKGYRDAQCGWIEVEEDVTREQKVAVYLIIYAPKKGIIEVWTIQHGTRIASFHVSKFGQLLYTNYGLMGLNNIHLRGGNKAQYPVMFIDPVGIISEISVPFHFVLNAKNSKRARDVHVLKKFKLFLKEQFDCKPEDLCKEVRLTLTQIRTPDLQTAALETLSASRVVTVEAMQAALQVITEQQGQSTGSEDLAEKALAAISSNLQHLVGLFHQLNVLNEKPPGYDSTLREQPLPEMLTTQLNTSPEEVTRLVNLFSTLEMLSVKEQPRTGCRVVFGDTDTSLRALVEFLASFDLRANDIHFKTTANQEQLLNVGRVLLEGALIGADIEEWTSAVKSSSVEPMELVQCALHYWLSRAHPVSLNDQVADMLHLAELFKVLCELAGSERVRPENNQESPWWQEVRTTLMRSNNPWAALTAAIVCRSVALSIERDGAGADDWEHISFDTCQWGVLNARLEDLAVLVVIINQKGGNYTGSKPIKKHSLNDDPIMQLDALLSRGKGGIAEIVAAWLGTWVVDPLVLLDLLPEDDEKQDSGSKGGIQDGQVIPQEEGSDAVQLPGASGNNPLASYLHRFGVLRQHFPYSMSDNVLLSNMCWDNIVNWSRLRTSELGDSLEVGINCLKIIPCPSLRRGLCSMIWSMFLCPSLEEIAKNIQHKGRVPKQRLVNLASVCVPDSPTVPFLQQCLAFLDVFLDVCSSEEGTVTPPIRMCEELWEGNPIGPPPLVELALVQPESNYDLLQLHYQVVLMLLMMATFNLKQPRPLTTLLDAAGQAALFTDLTGRPRLPSHHPDTPLVTARTHFLCRVITAAIQTIERLDADSGMFEASQGVKWWNRCLTLASVWSVSSDNLRRHQICELYSSGFDRLAEDSIPAVNDKPLLASQLLLIVGQRMRQIVQTSPDLGNKMSKLGAALSTWLNTMPEDHLKTMNTSLDDMAQLIVQVMQFLPEDHQEFELALNMVDAIHAFRDAASEAATKA